MNGKLPSLPPPPVVIGGSGQPVEADAPPARILMVDDHAPNLLALAAILDPLGQDLAYIFRGYKEGAVDYLLKPFDPEILRAKVSVFVDLWRKNELLRRQQAMLRARELIEVEKRGELRFRALTDSMPQCVWAARRDGEIYYCNRIWREYAGEEAGITFFDAVPAEELEEVRRSYQKEIGR